MKLTHRLGTRLVLASVIAFTSYHSTLGAAELDRVALAGRISRAVVRVKYELQFDQADAPTGGLGRERCPNCGNFHDTDLQSYLTEERPVETAGYLIATDRLVSLDPLIHPRFLRSITVQFGDQIVPAAIDSVARDQRAVFLKLDRPLSGAEPLTFAAKPREPALLVTYSAESGQWVTGTQPFPRNVVMPATGEPYLLTGNRGIAVSAEGDVLGIALGSRLALSGGWQGSPTQWAAVALKEILDRLDALEATTAKTLPHVHLQLRSPRSEREDYLRSTNFGDDEGRIGDDATEANVPGVVLPEGRVLVLASLKPKQTARLETISVWLGDEPVTAEFEYSLKEFGAFTARLKEQSPTIVTPHEGVVSELLEQLLWRAEIRIRGESRQAYFNTGRISACKVGAHNRLYPLTDDMGDGASYLFDEENRLVALPLSRRSPLAERNQYWNSDEPELTPVAYVLSAVSRLPATADVANVPVSEEEASRLAWLGVELQPMSQELARANGVATETDDGETGGLVTYVYPDSPAAQAGIGVGSILLRLHVPGQPLPINVHLEEDPMSRMAFPWDRLDQLPEQYFDRVPMPWPRVESEFIRTVTDLGFGTRFNVEWVADGKTQQSSMEVMAGPAHYGAAKKHRSDRLGTTVKALTYEVRRYLQLQVADPGVVVAKIEPGSRASIAGVKPYELITHVNDQPIPDVESFGRLTEADGEFSLTVKRMNNSRIVTVKARGN